MKIYKNLFKNKTKNNFVDIMESIINELEIDKNMNYRRNVKYTNMDYIYGIIEVLSNNISWRNIMGSSVEEF